MDKKTMFIIVGVIAVIAVAAVAAYFLMGNNPGNPDEPDPEKVYNIDTRMRVFGNADNNDYLDENDYNLIKEFADGKATWNASKNPLADVNGDGKITAADYNLVRGYLDGKAGTMYYVDWDNKRSSIDYPLTRVLDGGYGIHSMFSTGLDWMIILGLYDKVTYMSNGDIGPDDLDETMYPNASKMKVFNDMSLSADHYETFMKEKIKITMGDKRFYLDTFLNAAKNNYSKYNLNVIKLTMNRTIGDMTWEDSMITLGAMFNKQDKTHDYITYINKINYAVEQAVKTAGVGEKTYLMPYTAPGYYLNPMYVDAHGSGDVLMGDVYTVEKLPLTSAVSVITADGFDEVEAETIISYNPDVLIISSFGYASSKSMTKEQYDAHLEAIAKIFRTMGYQKPIYGIAFENCCMAGSAFILTLANDIWGNAAFDYDTAWEYMYEYYDDFTNFDGTLQDLKDSKFAVWKYSA